MKVVHRNTILVIAAVVILVVFMVAGLPYSRFGWRSALAQSDYTGGGNLAGSQAQIPASQLDPQTALAYTDSNGGLSSGQLFARLLDSAGVGDAGVVSRGLIAAADFEVIGGDPFAPFPTPVRACVRGVGRPVFIAKSANGAGAAVDYPTAPTDSAGETCVFIYAPGIVALVQNQPYVASVQAAAPSNTNAEPDNREWALVQGRVAVYADPVYSPRTIGYLQGACVFAVSGGRNSYYSISGMAGWVANRSVTPVSSRQAAGYSSCVTGTAAIAPTATSVPACDPLTTCPDHTTLHDLVYVPYTSVLYDAANASGSAADLRHVVGEIRGCSTAYVLERSGNWLRLSAGGWIKSIYVINVPENYGQPGGSPAAIGCASGSERQF